MGTARVPLAALLRKGNEHVGNAGVVKEYLAVDVLATQLNSIDSVIIAVIIRLIADRKAPGQDLTSACSYISSYSHAEICA